MAVAAHLAVRPRSLPVVALLALALLGAVLSTAIASIVAPNDVFGLAVPKVTACSGVNVRTTPSTTAADQGDARERGEGHRALTVKGARWTVSCGGHDLDQHELVPHQRDRRRLRRVALRRQLPLRGVGPVQAGDDRGCPGHHA